MSGSPISKKTKFSLLAPAFKNGKKLDKNSTLAEDEEPEIKSNIDENRNDHNNCSSGSSENDVMSTSLIYCAPFINTEEANENDGIHNFADKLCEQKLLIIFENTILDTNDLLNFRLVKKSWREAATTVLLQRNACQLQFVSQFGNSNSKHLLSIEDPNQHLPLLVSQNMVSLVKNLVYNPYKNNNENNNLSTFRSFSKLNPKLSQLTVDLTKIIPQEGLYSSVVKYLNSILESSKDTLTTFEIGVNPTDFLRNIKIPSMKNLKSLKLTQVSTKFTRRNNNTEPGQKFKSFRFYTSESSGESDKLKASFFPNLVKVDLDVRNYNVNNRLLGFLKFNSVAPVKPYVRHGDVISSVKALEICGSNTLPDIRRAELISKLFPGITTLKIKCDNTITLVNSLWVLCPLAEYVEIYGVSNPNVNFREALKLGVLSRDGGPGRPAASASVSASVSSCDPNGLSSTSAVSNIDHFFTGFPVELCEKLRRKDEFPTETSNCEANANFLRKDPSICSLKYLKNFKIKFLSLSKPFASQVSGIYAFQKMPGTSITFSFDPASMTDAQINDTEKYLEPLAPYLQLTRGK